MPDSTSIVTNRLLCSLLVATERRLSPYLEEVSLVSGQTIYESGAKITDIYFPQNARLSLLLIMGDRFPIEITSIGNEGLVGIPAILGGNLANTSSVVQIPGTTMKLPAEVINQEFKRGEDLQQILLLYTQAQINQISQIAACRSRHDIEQRLARWLLSVDNNGQQDTLPLTQKFISLMLGVRRASITEIAISLQKQGIIQYSRGKIAILNRSKLELIACECYDKIQNEYKRLLEPKLSKKN